MEVSGSVSCAAMGVGTARTRTSTIRGLRVRTSSLTSSETFMHWFHAESAPARVSNWVLPNRVVIDRTRGIAINTEMEHKIEDAKRTQILVSIRD